MARNCLHDTAAKMYSGPKVDAYSRELAAVAQINVGLIQPVFPRRGEHIQGHGIFEGPCLMRHIRWDT
jgi:hypothetical protein